jgi:hypothetical protein
MTSGEPQSDLTLPARAPSAAAPQPIRSKYGRSLSFLQFKLRLTAELREFWYLTNSTFYAQRWVQSLQGNQRPATLGAYPGDGEYNFHSLDIPPSEFELIAPSVRDQLRNMAVVALVTTFEVYLSETLKRILVLEPTLLNTSGLEFTAPQIVDWLSSATPGVPFADTAGERLLRNKSHMEMIEKVSRFARADVIKGHSASVETWSNWVLARNSIVHLGGSVSFELAKAWPGRFPAAGATVHLSDKEVAHVGYLALRLASAIDSRAVDSVITDRDSHLLARELFARYGMADPRSLSRAVSKHLETKFSKNQAEKAVADQRRQGDIGGFQFSEQLIAAICP